MDIHKIINLKGKEIPKKDMVHFQPFKDSFNVRCLNGSAHARRTFDKDKVTCPKCLNPETGQGFWNRHEAKRGNENKVF